MDWRKVKKEIIRRISINYLENLPSTSNLNSNEAIIARDFQEAKAEYEPVIAKLEGKKAEAGNVNTQYKLYLTFGFQFYETLINTTTNRMLKPNKS